MKNNIKKLKKGDLCFLLIVFIAIILLFGIRFFMTRERGSYIEITVDNQLYGTYSLDEDRLIPIRIDDKITNKVRILNHEAFMEDADCPDKLCIHMGKISKNNETIVCLPEKVVIKVISDDNNNVLDDITN